MAELGKVIEALENCTAPEMQDDDETYVDCTRAGECPWDDCNGKFSKMMDIPLTLAMEALELLKAQEARVMTLTEAFDAEVAWLEMYANPDGGVEPIIQPVIIRYYENGYWQCLIEQDESADLFLFLDGFGTEFRFWTSRPTDEQREAVKWE